MHSFIVTRRPLHHRFSLSLKQGESVSRSPIVKTETLTSLLTPNLFCLNGNGACLIIIKIAVVMFR